MRTFLIALCLLATACPARPAAKAQAPETEPTFAAASRAEDAPGPCSACGPIVLVRLEDSGAGPVTQAYVEDLAFQLTNTYGLDVSVAPAIVVPAQTMDGKRGQYDGTGIVDVLKTTLTAPSNGGPAVIALMNDDIFVSWKPEWKWAFGARSTFEDGGGWSVISAHRMAGAPAPRRMMVMLGKYIGGIACGFDEVSDRSSIMYDEILSANDLDRMRAVACH